MKFKITIIALAIIIIIAVGFYFFRPTQKVILNWEVGDKRMYNFLVKTKSRLFLKTDNKSNTIITESSGVLNFHILEKKQNRIYVGIQFSPVKILLNNQKEEGLQKIYETFFVVAFLDDGMPFAFHFPSPISREDSRTLVSFLRNFQLKLLNEEKEWSVQEINSYGEVFCYYKPLDAYRIKKKSIHFDNVFLRNEIFGLEEKTETKLLYSENSFKLSENSSWLESAEGKEGFVSDSSTTEVKSEISFELQEIHFSPNLEIAIWKEKNKNLQSVLARFEQGTKKSTSYFEDKMIANLKEAYEKINFQEALQSYFENINKDSNALFELRDFLLANPEKSLEIPNVLLYDPRVNPKKAALLIHILKIAGTPEAQKALRQIVQNPEQIFQNRIDSINAMSLLKNPVKETHDFLWQSYYKESKDHTDIQISNSSLLALGTYVYTQKGKTIPPEEDKTIYIKQKLKDELQKRKSTEKKNIVLKAIGNTKDDSFFQDVKPFTDSKDMDTRSVAYQSMRLMRKEEVQETLRQGLSKEKEQAVKNIILDIMLSRQADETSLLAVKKTISSETNDLTRLKMYKYLVINKKMLEDSEGILKKILESEKNPEFRELLEKEIKSKSN